MNVPLSPCAMPVVRIATAADATVARACVAAAFEPYIARMGKAPGPMLLDYPRLIDAGRVWVAELGSELVGVLVQYETDDGFYIDTVAVGPDQQGTGVGRALLEFAEAEALRRGFTSIYLCTNAKMTENQSFYPRIGYLLYDRKVQEGYDRLFYRKPLGDHRA
jgi:GNAT superfamily N-acetyltransferase